ncbi:MAG: hypothetical protein WD273_05640 [Trueperaceae bacterium]
MALERYPSIDQAKDATDNQLDAASALDRMLELVSLTPANRPPLFEPGIYRFRSLDEANEARELATATRMRMLRAARSSTSKLTQ